jgi:hypothetical protein
MTSTPTRKRTGRLTVLTPTVHNRIVSLVTAGNYLSTAAEAVGVARSSVYRWIDWGKDEAQRIARGDPPDPEREAFLAFYEATTKARASRETVLVDVLDKVIQGGTVTKRTPLTDRGKLVRDDDGEIVYVEEMAPPDGKLALEVLARTKPDDWARRPPTQVEITGAGGGPIEVDGPGAVASLVARIAAVREQREEDDQLMLGGTDVVDAEIVDDA